MNFKIFQQLNRILHGELSRVFNEIGVPPKEALEYVRVMVDAFKLKALEKMEPEGKVKKYKEEDL